MIAGRFVIERLAGEGGMGRVYYARDTERGGAVALKVLSDRARTQDREARTLIDLLHPAIVRCIAFGKTDDGADFIATEWLDGETLRTRLERGALSVALTLHIARRVAEGLAAAHGWGIVHRDVTPANIMLANAPDGVDGDVKLLDFGLAVHGRGTGAAGTVGYAAPEQARGERVTARADVFSLGCVIYQCILGEKPFAAQTDVAVMARMLEEDTGRVTARLEHVPDALASLLARMLSMNPERRPHDGAAVVLELAAIAPILPSNASQPRGSVTDAEARTSQVLVAEIDNPEGARIAAELEALGGHVTREGSRVVCAWSTASAVERAVRAARGALAVLRWNAHARASLVAAQSDVSGLEAAVSSLPDAPSIRVDADTARLLGDRFTVRPDGDDLVLVREGAGQHSRTSLLGRETKCVGRDREINLIVSVFDECKDEPDSRVVWLLGAPGIGKTRVRDEVLVRIADHGARVWSAQADPTRASVAFGVLGDLVRSAAAIARDDDESYQHTALVTRACRNVPDADRPRVVEFLAELLRLHIEEPSAQLLAAREEPLLMGDQVRRAMSDLVLAELDQAPICLVTEDLQWADTVTVRVLGDLARIARERPLFVFLVGRPEAKDTHVRLVADRQPTGVSLGKLGTKSMEKLVAEALACDSSDPRVASISERAAGNPFFAEEIVRAMQAGDASPTAALAMLEARIMSLEPEARRVLRAASVFGQRFTSREAGALLGEDASEQFVDAWCGWLVEREILAQTGNVWSFRHALVRDVAHGMLTDSDRAAAHGLAAELLEREARVPGPVIAEHWSRAGEHARAARWLAASAVDALEANDLAACVDLGERALTALKDQSARGDLLVVLAEAHRWRGEYERGAECARAALAIVPEGEARFFRAASELTSITGSVGPPEEFEWAIQKLALVKQEHGDAASIAWSRAALQLLVRGDTRADALLERAERAASSDLARGRVEQSYAVRAGIRGELEELVRRYEASVSALERAGDVRGACVQELNLASALCELGEDDTARSHLAHGQREAETRGLMTAVALAHHLAGILFSREDRLNEAIAAQRRALETFAAQGNDRMAGGVRCYLAELLLKRGKTDEALHEAVESEKLLARVPLARTRALAVLALVHLARGEVEAALAASAESVQIAESTGVESGESLVYRARAEALALAGSPDANALRQRGRSKLVKRAAAIADPKMRQSFLEVPENAALLR